MEHINLVLFEEVYILIYLRNLEGRRRPPASSVARGCFGLFKHGAEVSGCQNRGLGVI